MLEKMDYEFFKLSGKIFIDDGAVKALKNGQKFLAAGITKVEGKF